MERKEAYERLELPEGADLQEVRRKFAEMYNDCQMRIDNAPRHMRQMCEQHVETLKEAYALLNGSDGMDDTGDLPRTGQSGSVEEPTGRQHTDAGGSDGDIDHALAVFGLGKSFPRHRLAATCQQHIAELKAQLAATTLPSVKSAYEKEVANAHRAWDTIANWLAKQGVDVAAQPEEVALEPPPAAAQQEREPVAAAVAAEKSSGGGRIAAILVVLAVLAGGGYWWWSQQGKAAPIDPTEPLAVTDVSDTTENNAADEPAGDAESTPTTPSGAAPTAANAERENTAASAKALYRAGVEYNDQKNYVEAAKLFRQAAEQGEPRAMYMLAIKYQNGEGVGKSQANADRWYKEAFAALLAAAAGGDADAQRLFGHMHYFGKGTKVNFAEAVKWYLKAANKGDALSQNNLGVVYRDGNGVKQDDNEAVKWFRKAAERGSADAQHNLAVMYENGQGVTEDDAEAVKWYRRAADQGYAAAQANLGVMYANGRGVTKDDAEAVKWYRRAADQGYASAQSNLGWMYANGNGVSKDDAEAVKWYRKAADQGYASAQTNLGWMYDNGSGGLAKDPAIAHKWYMKAAQQGNASAQFNVGWNYAHGEGVSQNQQEAINWYKKAAKQGNQKAINNLKSRGITDYD